MYRYEKPKTHSSNDVRHSNVEERRVCTIGIRREINTL